MALDAESRFDLIAALRDAANKIERARSEEDERFALEAVLAALALAETRLRQD
jgi:hypothetical protein